MCVHLVVNTVLNRHKSTTFMFRFVMSDDTFGLIAFAFVLMLLALMMLTVLLVIYEGVQCLLECFQMLHLFAHLLGVFLHHQLLVVEAFLHRVVSLHVIDDVVLADGVVLFMVMWLLLMVMLLLVVMMLVMMIMLVAVIVAFWLIIHHNIGCAIGRCHNRCAGRRHVNRCVINTGLRLMVNVHTVSLLGKYNNMPVVID